MQTATDAEIVGWLSRIGAAGIHHVMVRFGMRQSWADARLGRLVADGLLELKTPPCCKAGLYTASAAGLRSCGLSGLGVYQTSSDGFEHAQEVTSSAVTLYGGLPAWKVMSEREIRAAESDGGELLASVRVGDLADGRSDVRRPDLALISPDGRVLAIEVELTVKTLSRLAEFCHGYARAKHIKRVYYLAATAAAPTVSRVVLEAQADDRITVLQLGDIESLIRIEYWNVRDD